MGYWNLKPKEQLDSWRCFEAREDNVEDYVDFNTKDGFLTDVDREHIFGLIKEGIVEGEVNDWDGESMEVNSKV